MQRHFSTNSRVIKDLFAQYENTFVAFCELITNSIQADANNIKIHIDYVLESEVYHSAVKSIVIEDDGSGVSISDLDNKILDIGTNVKSGGKGIGRFSALQIGAAVEIESISFDQKLNKFTKFLIPLKQDFFKTNT